MSVEQMASELQVSRQTISRWQNDHGTPPKRVYIQAWANTTGVPFDWLQGPDPTRTDPDSGDDVISGRRWSWPRRTPVAA